MKGGLFSLGQQLTHRLKDQVLNCWHLQQVKSSHRKTEYHHVKDKKDITEDDKEKDIDGELFCSDKSFFFIFSQQ